MPTPSTLSRTMILVAFAAKLGCGQNTLIDEPFNGPGLPPGWSVQSGSVSVQNGFATLNTACLKLPGSYDRSQGLTVEADVTIRDGAIGDFNIWALYDTVPNCHSGPTNGYYTGWYPAGSDNPLDTLQRIEGGVGTSLVWTPATISANTKYRIKLVLLADGTINTYINGVLSITTVDNVHTSGFLTLRSWQSVDIDNVLVTSGSGSSFQVRYVSNLNLGDSVINMTNSGARGAGLASGISAGTTGAICVNVYAFSPDEQLVSCCSCPVTPNGLISLSAREDLVSNTLTPAVPTSIVIKLYASIPVAGSCSGSASAPGNASPGLAAWGTSLHAPTLPGLPAPVTETAFLPATLSPGELTRLTSLCSFINATGSGFGICRSCRLGGLGAGRI